MKKNIKLFISTVILIVIVLTLINFKEVPPPADNLKIQVASGYDIVPAEKNYNKIEVVRQFVIFGESNNRSSSISISDANTIGQTRQLDQLKSDKEKLLGFVKDYILSSEYARNGIRDMISTQFKDAKVNDTSLFLVCKGRPSDILSYKPVEDITAGDFIEELIKNHIGNDFFSDEYDQRDMFVRLDSEGRNINIPYIELTEEGIKISGMALFKNDKMAAIADIKNSRIMNMLINNGSSGVITLNKNNKYIDFITKSKNKVKCKRNNGKYSFVINLSLDGNIATNTIFDKPITTISEEKDFEKLMAESVKKQCEEFINKMKTDYKVDCLELGRVAAAKYGRRTGTDWNKVVMDSDIKINVKVKLNKQGRGDY